MKGCVKGNSPTPAAEEEFFDRRTYLYVNPSTRLRPSRVHTGAGRVPKHDYSTPINTEVVECLWRLKREQHAG